MLCLCPCRRRDGILLWCHISKCAFEELLRIEERSFRACSLSLDQRIHSLQWEGSKLQRNDCGRTGRSWPLTVLEILLERPLSTSGEVGVVVSRLVLALYLIAHIDVDEGRPVPSVTRLKASGIANRETKDLCRTQDLRVRKHNNCRASSAIYIAPGEYITLLRTSDTRFNT